MATLSLCIIVRDEERFLRECIEHVQDIVDEIIVVMDSRSKDNSEKIVEDLGIKPTTFEWIDDFSAIRNFSLEQAKSNWILVLDADERLDEAGKENILELINKPEYAMENIIGFKLDQRTYNPKNEHPTVTTDEDQLRDQFDGFTSSKLVRLFKNNPKIRFKNKIHELVENSIKDTNGKIIETDISIHHFGLLKGKKFTEEKTGTYVDMIWKQLEKEPNNPRYNYQVGIAFIDAKKPNIALKYFLKTLQLDPKYPKIISSIAKLYVELNNIPKAIKFFNIAIATNKQDVESMNNLAFIYIMMKKFGIAKKLLDKALQLDPTNKYILANHKKLIEKISQASSAK